jgi:hypothetical protein
MSNTLEGSFGTVISKILPALPDGAVYNTPVLSVMCEATVGAKW